MDSQRSFTFEPFRIKSIETIKTTTKEERLKYLKEASYNPFMVKSENIMIDLLTDSGTGAMSSDQWSAIMRGDEAYAGSSSFHKFEEVVKDIYGFRHVIPTHQGRAAERILFSCVLESGDIVPNNAHFDTTRANVEAQGAYALNLPSPYAMDKKMDYPFKGNMNTGRLEDLLSSGQRKKVKMVLLTITNNALGEYNCYCKQLKKSNSKNKSLCNLTNIMASKMFRWICCKYGKHQSSLQNLPSLPGPLVFRCLSVR